MQLCFTAAAHAIKSQMTACLAGKHFLFNKTHPLPALLWGFVHSAHEFYITHLTGFDSKSVTKLKPVGQERKEGVFRRGTSEHLLVFCLCCRIKV